MAAFTGSAAAMNITSTFRDADIRPELRSLLLRQNQNERGTVLVEELGFCWGQARIDLALVNGLLHGYEIKSDRDSLRRLGGQVHLYGKVLDMATLVAGDRHVDEAAESLPDWWGILKVKTGASGPSFESLRSGRKNPHRDPRALVELIWLDEAIALLEQRGFTRGVRGKPRRVVWDRVCEHFALEEIASLVRCRLKARAVPVPAAPLS